ncbi:iron-sulfur cluster assembly accessory protein [Thiohalophilus sp.]|uniref:HesB/IscA family protein n=1 Tax=Thiohalophilus sp. TaxID=3028392 RepID=UPI002ACE4EB9|nr:iron-sulfur cluster assembly accessory protein [Thiohalophilus sp.]MDZ7662863.1 iron-sulfur cluster assembly accessory protein [Thiohalophilus sp.]
MITVTPKAAEQIKQSAKQNQMEGMPIRIAAKRDDAGSIQYAMGFADQQDENDISYTSEGVSVMVPPDSVALLQGATLDFVELESGEFNFIFLNPNDPEYVPPKADSDSSHYF